VKDLTKGNEASLIIVFALPMLIGNVFQQFYNMVDSWVVGRYVGTTALAAVGAATPIIFLVIALAMGVTMGANVLIAQFYGAKDEKRIRTMIDTTYIALFFTSLLVTVVGVFTVGPLLTLLRIPEEVWPEATTYLRIIMAGLLFTFGYNGVGAILRGLGDSMTPLYMLILSTLINITLDLVFVRVFSWGVTGVALATVIAQAVSFIASLVYLNLTHPVLRTNFLKLSFNSEMFRQSLAIGVPSGLQQALASLGGMFMSAVINGYGTAVIAGFATANRIELLAGMPAMNIGMALSAFTGQNIGAGKMDRVKRGFHAALLIGVALTIVIMTGMFIFARHIIGFFTDDLAVIAVGVQYLQVMSPLFFLFTIMFTTNGLIRGAGEGIVPMVSTLLATWAARIPCALLFSHFWGVIGLWFASPAGWILGDIIVLSYYKSQRWTKKSFTATAASDKIRTQEAGHDR
jgi:putative MATE family efflux protein